MTSHQLVDTPNTTGSRRRPARRARYALELEGARAPSSDGEASVWIVDAQGILILPADQYRLEMAFVAKGATEPPDGNGRPAASSTSPNER